MGNPDCKYKISLQNGTVVNMSIIDMNLKESNQCHNSFVEIRTGNSGNSPLLGRYCGNMSNVPEATLQSAGPDVWIR